MFRKLAALVLVAGIGFAIFTLGPRIAAHGPNRLDRSALILTFEETFARQPTFYDPQMAPTGRWKTNYAFGPQDPRSLNAWQARTHAGSNEMQYYGDPVRGTGPFSWQPGALTIVGKPNPHLANPASHQLPFLSGLMTTEKSFEQTYGYFEIRAALPVGKGLWSAFWLLPRFEVFPDPLVRQLPDEVDVFENIGNDSEIYAIVQRNIKQHR